MPFSVQGRTRLPARSTGAFLALLILIASVANAQQTRQPQTIFFGPFSGSGQYGSEPYLVTATSNSMLPVTISSNSLSICAVSLNQLTILALRHMQPHSESERESDIRTGKHHADF